MKTIKLSAIALCLATSSALLFSACSKDGDDTTPTPPVGDKVYLIGAGVTTPSGSTNYILQTSDLSSGKISLINNGILQDGYREYIGMGSYFFSIGGLGVNDVISYSLNNENQVVPREGLVFQNGASDYIDVNKDGKTLLGAVVTTDDKYEGNAEFFIVDVASNTIAKKVLIPAKTVYNGNHNIGWNHTGVAIRGNKAFQTVYPISKSFATPDFDRTYVAVYSYPDFTFEKLIEDTRATPAGAPLLNSGIFSTESGDLYTVSHDGYGYDQHAAAKKPTILKIANGAETFDADYIFHTEDVANGGKVIRANYIGGGKLLAQLKTGTQNGAWDQTGLSLAIVDLVAKTITPVQGTPTYDGAEAVFVDEGKAYVSAKVGNALNIYVVDLAAATATKGVEIEATYVKGLGRIR